MLRHEAVTEGRKDFSLFLVHLTRDDRGEKEGLSATENFSNILLNKKITALRPHCLHQQQIPERHRPKFRVSCFTETPLDQIHHLTKEIPGRKYNFSPYGFVFKREVMLEKGAQKVTPVSTYGGDERRKSYEAIFQSSLRKEFQDEQRHVLPFLSAQHSQFDFSWECEWRVLGDVEFFTDELHCVILPEGEDQERLDWLAMQAVPYICPSWSYERIVWEFAEQQRLTKQIWKPKPNIPRLPTRPFRVVTKR